MRAGNQMKIGVLSDTHDRLPTFRRAVAMFRQIKVGAIFHAGDYVAPFAAQLITAEVLPIPLYCVYGNNDGEREGLKRLLPGIEDGPLKVTLDGRSIVMQHFIDWLKPEDIKGVDVVISGHSHEVVNKRENGQLLLNPGECCGWVSDRPTVAVVDLQTLTADVIEVHE